MGKMGILTAVALGCMAATPMASPVLGRSHLAARWALSRMQELNIQQLEALYSLLDDDGDGELTVHEMIDLFDGINNDALLIDDCDGNPNPHHCVPRSFTHLHLEHFRLLQNRIPDRKGSAVI